MVGALALLALLVTAGVVATVAWHRLETWATTTGLARARDQLASALRTDDVTLTVDARPLVPALLRGTTAQVVARRVPVGDADAHLRRLDAAATQVRVDRRTRRLTTAPGTFTAVLGQDDLSRAVRLPGVVSRLELRRHGVRAWTVLGVPVDTSTELVDGELRVVPDPLQVRDLLRLPGLGAFRRTLEAGGLRIALPELPLGARVESLAFGEGEVVVRGRFDGLDLPLRS